MSPKERDKCEFLNVLSQEIVSWGKKYQELVLYYYILHFTFAVIWEARGVFLIVGGFSIIYTRFSHQQEYRDMLNNNSCSNAHYWHSGLSLGGPTLFFFFSSRACPHAPLPARLLAGWALPEIQGAQAELKQHPAGWQPTLRVAQECRLWRKEKNQSPRSSNSELVWAVAWGTVSSGCSRAVAFALPSGSIEPSS